MVATSSAFVFRAEAPGCAPEPLRLAQVRVR
jgi:hypothetical protein